MRKSYPYIVILLIVSFLIIGCSNQPEKEENLLGINFNIENNESTLDKYETDNPVVAMYIEKYGAIVLELYPDKAPNTVNNFISLIKSGFYDNNTFHRLVPGFVLQGGDPTGTGTGGPGYTIKGEFNANNYNNPLKHKEWTLSMARSSSYDSAGSQFFIMLGDASYLDGQYAAFGQLIDGKDTIKEIEKNEIVEDEQTGKLKNNLTIKKTIIDLKNKVYNDVEKITS